MAETLPSWIQVSSALVNEEHDADSYSVQPFGDGIILAVCDGITNDGFDPTKGAWASKGFIRYMNDIIQKKPLPASCVHTNPREALDNLVQQAAQELSISSRQIDHKCATTLALAMIFPSSDRRYDLHTYCLGDSRIHIYTAGEEWFHHFVLTGERGMEDAISAKRGVIGRADEASRVLYLGDTVIVASDGGDPEWTGRCGEYRAAVFKNTYRLHQGDSFGQFAAEMLKKKASGKPDKKLDDDATLIVARIRK